MLGFKTHVHNLYPNGVTYIIPFNLSKNHRKVALLFSPFYRCEDRLREITFYSHAASGEAKFITQST